MAFSFWCTSIPDIRRLGFEYNYEKDLSKTVVWKYEQGKMTLDGEQICEVVVKKHFTGRRLLLCAAKGEKVENLHKLNDELQKRIVDDLDKYGWRSSFFKEGVVSFFAVISLLLLAVAFFYCGIGLWYIQHNIKGMLYLIPIDLAFLFIYLVRPTIYPK